MKKVSEKLFGLILAGVFTIGMSTIPFTSNAQINPECPNGCLDQLGQCYCYGTHASKEASWEQIDQFQ